MFVWDSLLRWYNGTPPAADPASTPWWAVAVLIMQGVLIVVAVYCVYLWRRAGKGAAPGEKSE